MYKKKKDGTFVTPKELKNQRPSKTVIKGLTSNLDYWKGLANEAADNVIKLKIFPVSGGKFIGTTSNGTVIEGWYRGSSIQTIYPQF